MNNVKKVGRPKEENPRDIVIKFKVNKEENEKIEKLANEIGMNKSRLIRNIVLGDLGEIKFSKNIGMLPLIQNIQSFIDKTRGVDYLEKIKFETDEEYFNSINKD